MKDPIPVPSKGTPLRASWGAAVANGMNAYSSMSSPGMLAREGLAGNGSEPLPQNRRERKSGGSTFVDRSCFRLDTRSVNVQGQEEPEAHLFVICNYYNLAGMTGMMADADVQALVDEASAAGSVLFVKFPHGGTPSFDICEYSDLADEQSDGSYYVFPLYLFTSTSGSVPVADLRTAPQIQVFDEFAPSQS